MDSVARARGCSLIVCSVRDVFDRRADSLVAGGVPDKEVPFARSVNVRMDSALVRVRCM
jgi:hypothetical protein